MPDPDVMRFSTAVDLVTGAIPSLLKHRKEIITAWWTVLSEHFDIDVIERGMRRLAETWDMQRGYPTLKAAIECCQVGRRHLAMRKAAIDIRAFLPEPEPIDETLAHNAGDMKHVATMLAKIERMFDVEICTAAEMVERMETYNGNSRWRLLPINENTRAQCKEEMKAIGLDPDNEKQFEMFWQTEHQFWKMMR